MKWIKNFALFETNSSYRFYFSIPKSQAETDVVNKYPEVARLIKACQILSPGFVSNGYVYNSRSGTIEFYTPLRYSFKITKNGTIYYGGIVIGPSTNFVFDDLHSITDFITVYAISKMLDFTVNTLSRFVFDGNEKGLSLATYTKITRRPDLEKLVIEIADKYNLGLASGIFSRKKAESDKLFIDPKKIIETNVYKSLSDPFGLSYEFIHDGCIDIHQKYYTPFGIFDPGLNSKIMGKTYNSLEFPIRICLGPGHNMIKTLNALENLCKELIGGQIKARIENLKRTIERDPNGEKLIPLYGAALNLTMSVLSGNTATNLVPTIIKILEDLEKTRPLDFTDAFDAIKETGKYPEIVDHFSGSSDLLDAGRMLRGWGVGDED